MITNSFVGRSRELTQLARLLNSSRLVTVMGPPGAGKTRLASEAVRRYADRFHSVFWCELAQLQAQGLVKTSIGAALGFAPEVQSDIGRLANERFGDDSILLVIDNCEHLRTEVAATLGTLIESTQGLRVLATSRERLRAPGETAWILPPLSRDEAVELVLNRAAALGAPLDVAPDNRAALAYICERLGDLPLAIELIAPHLALLPAVQVAGMLDDALSLLASEGPTRQRSISAALDWSVGLLAPTSQDDLWRLGVFPTAFTLDAATAVLATSAENALARLGVIRDSSLIVVDVSGTSARFRLLEPIRQFVLAHLVASPLEREARRRHAEHVLLRSKWINDRLLGTPEQIVALAEFEELLPDIRQVVAWALEEETDWAVRIAANTGWAWEITGRLREGEALERRVLELVSNPVDRSRLLNRLGSLIGRRTGGGKPAGIDSGAILAARESGDKRELAFALCLASDFRRPEESAAQLDEAAGIGAEAGDRLILGWERFSRGILSALGGDPEAARTYFEEAIAHFSALGDPWCTSQSTANLVYTCLLLRDQHAARNHLRSVLPVLIAHPNWSDAASLVHHTALLASGTGRPVEALRLAAAHRRLSQEIGAAQWDTSAMEQTARTQLAGKSRPDRYMAEGARLSVTEALKLALDVVEQPLPSMIRRDLRNQSEPLTRREDEVVRLIADGLTNREIAARLFITERSAEGHVERIRNKLDVRSRTQVAVWAAEHGLTLTGEAEPAED